MAILNNAESRGTVRGTTHKIYCVVSRLIPRSSAD